MPKELNPDCAAGDRCRWVLRIIYLRTRTSRLPWSWSSSLKNFEAVAQGLTAIRNGPLDGLAVGHASGYFRILHQIADALIFRERTYIDPVLLGFAIRSCSHRLPASLAPVSYAGMWRELQLAASASADVRPDRTKSEDAG